MDEVLHDNTYPGTLASDPRVCVSFHEPTGGSVVGNKRIQGSYRDLIPPFSTKRQ